MLFVGPDAIAYTGRWRIWSALQETGRSDNMLDKQTKRGKNNSNWQQVPS